MSDHGRDDAAARAIDGAGRGEPDDFVLADQRSGALWLWLNRPDALNGISPGILDGLEAGLDRASDDPNVHAVVIAAKGRIFCAGADLKHVKSILDEPARAGITAQQAFLRRAGAVLDRVESFPKPVIAAVEGDALAGGLELALCADFVVASESARFGDAHANYGLLPGAGGSIRLPRRVGKALAKFLMFTGETMSSRELQHTDLVSAVTAPGEVVARVDQLVERIGRKSPAGLARMKHLVNDGLEVPLAVGLRMELEQSAAHESSPDFAEGMSAFFDKRRPVFATSE